MSNISKTSYTAVTCLQFVEQLTNKNLQGNQFRNNLTSQNNQYLGNRQGQWTQWRLSQGYKV